MFSSNVQQYFKLGNSQGSPQTQEFFHLLRSLQVLIICLGDFRKIMIYFSWILWYIWKNCNDKIYKNKNENSQEILCIAEIQVALWTEAQLMVKDNLPMRQTGSDLQSLGHTKICYVDGAWRNKGKFTGQG